MEPTLSISSSRTHQSTGPWSCHLCKFLRMSASQHRTLWKEIVVESAGICCQRNLAGTIHDAMGTFSADIGDVFVWEFELCRWTKRNWRTTPCWCTRDTPYGAQFLFAAGSGERVLAFSDVHHRVLCKITVRPAMNTVYDML